MYRFQNPPNQQNAEIELTTRTVIRCFIKKRFENELVNMSSDSILVCLAEEKLPIDHPVLEKLYAEADEWYDSSVLFPCMMIQAREFNIYDDIAECNFYKAAESFISNPNLIPTWADVKKVLYFTHMLCAKAVAFGETEIVEKIMTWAENSYNVLNYKLLLDRESWTQMHDQCRKQENEYQD